MKTRFLLVLVLLPLAALSAPRAKLDSLRGALSKQRDTARVPTLIKLSQAYLPFSKDSALLYARMLEKEAVAMGNPQRVCDAYIILGTCFRHLSQDDSAFSYKRKAIAVAEKNKYPKGLANALSDIGLYEKEDGRLDTALKYTLRAAEIRESMNDARTLGTSYINLAVIYYAMKQLDKALEHFEKASRYFLAAGQVKNYALAINNMAVVYDEQKRFDLALPLYMKSLATYDSLGDPAGISKSKINIGVLYRNTGKLAEAEEYLLSALDIKRAIGDKDGEAICLLDLAQVYRQQKKFFEAEKLLVESERLSAANGQKELSRDICLEFSELYKAQGNFEKALFYMTRFAEKRDSILSEQQVEALAEMETKYKTAKKEKENLQLKEEAHAREIELERRREQELILYAGLGVLVLVLGLGLYAYSVKRKSNRLLTDKNEQISRHNRTLKELNGKLIESEEELMQLNKTKDRLFSVIAHDISNPVKAIANYDQAILSRAGELSREQLVEALRKVDQSIQPLQGLIDNLLHWSLLQRNGATLNPESFAPWEVVSEVIAIYAPYAQQKNVKLLSEIPPGVRVFADKNMLRLVLRNLLSNAVKYSRAGGKVKIAAKPHGAKIRFSVSDEGEGISAEKIAEILRGKQVEPGRGTSSETGTGIGLSLVTEYLRVGGSELQVESSAEGSEFAFELGVG